MKTSSYLKSNVNVLLEWVYDNTNNITDSFSILKNSKAAPQLMINSYIGSVTNNNINNTLFPVNQVTNTYAKIDTSKYNFISLQNYGPQSPIQHDTLKVHLPVNYDFGEYLGFYVRVYTYDYLNKNYCNLCDFFYDRNDSSQSNILSEVVPPLLYDSTLWSGIISIDIPAVSAICAQRNASGPIGGSINDVLTNGQGLSLTSPIYVDFQFITKVTKVGTLTNYITSTPYTIQFPQAPSLSALTLYAQESSEGDYFEIYPLYNGNFNDFVTFMDTSVTLGKAYYCEYLITVFEQNIEGKTYQYTIDSDFTQIVEFRPIIKYSTSVASINIQMSLIDAVDGSVVTRNAIYGLLPEQTSKYALDLKKIKIRNTFNPIIYVKKSINPAQLDVVTRRDPSQVTITVDVPNVLDINGICAYSSNALNKRRPNKIDNFFAIGDLKILLTPFDNIFNFTLAKKDVTKLEFVDLTNCNNLQLCFKSDFGNYSFSSIIESTNMAQGGQCSFKVPQSSYQSLKKVYAQNANMYYITASNQNVTTVLYSGLFIPSDSIEATTIVNNNINSINNPQVNTATIIQDPSDIVKPVATVIRKIITVTGTASGG